MASLTNFNFTTKYQHGRNNAAADALSRVNKSLNAHDIKAILDEMAIRCPDWAELAVLTSQQSEEEEWVWVSATWAPKEEMHVIDWLEAKNKDPII